MQIKAKPDPLVTPRAGRHTIHSASPGNVSVHRVIETERHCTAGQLLKIVSPYATIAPRFLTHAVN